MNFQAMSAGHDLLVDTECSEFRVGSRRLGWAEKVSRNRRNLSQIWLVFGDRKERNNNNKWQTKQNNKSLVML